MMTNPKRSTQLICLLVLALTWDSSRLAQCRDCSKTDISFFELLNLPDGGYLVDPARNESRGCNLVNLTYCKITSLRTYLPKPHHLFEVLTKQKNSRCDLSFSALLERWMKSYSKVEPGPGLPFNKWKDKKSVGKYIRFNTFMEFSKFRGLPNDILTNFDYEGTKLGWPWTDSVKICAGAYKGWNCAFESFNATGSEHYLMLLQEARPTIDITMEEMFSFRRSKPNHVVQILFFGKVMSILTEPSVLVQDYMSRHLVSVNDHIWTDRHQNYKNRSQKSHAISKKQFGSYKEIVNAIGDFGGGSTVNVARNEVDDVRYATVSMHVRRGDSCDVELDRTIDINVEQMIKDKIHRPCFSVDVYMRKLHYLRKRYNVIRVLLATDSVEMIKRTHLEPSFNWVYLDIDRHAFDKGKGWIEFREDDLNEFVLMSTVGDLNLLRYGDIFLGAFSSHYSKIAFYLMVGHSMRIPPFLSIDLALPFNPFDNCTAAWVGEHEITMEWMFLHGLVEPPIVPPLKAKLLSGS